MQQHNGAIPAYAYQDVVENGASYISQSDYSIHVFKLQRKGYKTVAVVLAVLQTDNLNHFSAGIKLTHIVPNDNSLGRSVVDIKQELFCMPQAFIYSKHESWHDKMDWIFMALKEAGFDQKYYYRSQNNYQSAKINKHLIL